MIVPKISLISGWLKFVIQLWSLTLVNGQSVNVDADIPRTTCQMLNARGFGCDIHHVTTMQNYIIELHRVTNGQLNPSKRPVILQTGLLGTSADFVFGSTASEVTPDPSVVGQSMAIELSKQGYDVWLSNNRGGKYGRNHTKLTPEDSEFWDFSWDEISQYDIPAIIDYVIDTTGSAKIHYVGHSQGTAVMFALLTHSEIYTKKVDAFVAISPITEIGGAWTSFRLVTAGLDVFFHYRPEVEIFGQNPITSTVVPYSCTAPIVNSFCESVFFSVTGPNFKEMNKERLPVYLSHMPTSTSCKNLLHFDQMFKTNKFAHYDYGIIDNIKHYGQLEAPLYDLSKIRHPNITVIYGQNDWFVPSKSQTSGVLPLKGKLPNTTEFWPISDPKSNHIDPLVGEQDAVEVNRKVIGVLSQF